MSFVSSFRMLMLGGGALLVVSTANAAEPIASLPSFARSLDWDAEHRVVTAAMALGGVAFVELGDPETGQEIGVHIHQDWPALDALAVGGGNILLAGRFGILQLVGKDPDGTYRERWRMDVEGIPTGLERQGNTLVVASGGAGLFLYEWPETDKEPRLRGRYPFVDYSKQTRLMEDGLLYLADNHDTGLQILQVSDLQRPVSLSMRQYGFVDSVTVQEHYAIVASRWIGAVFFDVSDPKQPREAGSIGRMPPADPENPGQSSLRVASDDSGRLLVSEGAAGARLFQLDTSGNVVRHSLLHQFPASMGGGIGEGIFLPDGSLMLMSMHGNLYHVTLPEGR